jgi:hypothetical protein
VAGHRLIDEYLAVLARRLPSDTVEELADGLAATYERLRSDGLDPDPAAMAALAEFGTPDAVLSAFARQAPGQRLARSLLYLGPVVGLCWGAAILTGHWPVPVPVRIAFGTALFAIVAALGYAATSRRRYRLTRIAGAAGLGVIALDTTILTFVATASVPFTWPLALAVPASLTRIAFTAVKVGRCRTPWWR